MRRLGIALGCGVLLWTACHVERHVAPEQVEGPHTWGAVENVTRLDHLWFAGQPDAAALAAARKAGVEVVINLREPEELDWDEAAAARELGLVYYHVPVARAAPFSPEAFEHIEELVHQHHDQEILLHCSSSNRVGGWLAIHLVEKHRMEPADALAVGRRAGITKDEIETKVRAYLAQPEAS